jgi:hypothetical protein
LKEKKRKKKKKQPRLLIAFFLILEGSFTFFNDLASWQVGVLGGCGYGDIVGVLHYFSTYNDNSCYA